MCSNAMLKKRLIQSRIRLILILKYHEAKLKAQQKRRKHWVHPLLQKRNIESDYCKLVNDMRILRPSFFFNAFRMTAETFEKLLQKVGSKITKQNTKLRKSISPAERLLVTLRFLATGDSYFTIASAYRISKSAMAKIVPETCNALWHSLLEEYMPNPRTSKWQQITNDYELLWQFPNCCGSIDGKHIVIQAPKNSGSLYFNYKKTFSVVLLAIVDARYNFVVVDIGSYGRQSDGSIFARSRFGKMMKEDETNFPADKPLPGTSTPALPHVIVGDEAFPVMRNLMRPYPGNNLPAEKRIFNYRLSRARRTVENTFGIMASRFRCFRRPLLLQPHNTVAVVKAAVILHNFLRQESGNYVSTNEFDYEDQLGNVHQQGAWRQEEMPSNQMLPLGRRGRRPEDRATAIRDQFKQYFLTQQGAVSWQSATINRLF